MLVIFVCKELPLCLLHCVSSVNRALDADLSRVRTMDLLTRVSYSRVRFAHTQTLPQLL